MWLNLYLRFILIEKNNPEMTDTTTYPSTLQGWSVSESDTEPLNSTVNPQGNPNLYIPSGRAESTPNIIIIDESPYTGPGTCLQLQWEGIETRIEKFMDCFQTLKKRINEWEGSIKSHTVSLIEINQKFGSFSKVITDLLNQAHLARVWISICKYILSLTDVIARIKLNGLKGVDSQIDIPIPRSDLSLNSSSHQELNLSSIDPPTSKV